MTAAARKRPTVMPTATVTRPAAASIAVPNAFELVVAESVAKRRRPPLARPAGAQRKVSGGVAPLRGDGELT